MVAIGMGMGMEMEMEMDELLASLSMPLYYGGSCVARTGQPSRPVLSKVVRFLVSTHDIRRPPAATLA